MSKPPLTRSVSRSLKNKVAADNAWRCAHCHHLLNHVFEVDHIVALQNGGTNDEVF